MKIALNTICSLSRPAMLSMVAPLVGIPIIGIPHVALATPSIHVVASYQLSTDGLPSGIVETCGGDGCDGSLSVIHDFTRNTTEKIWLSGSATFVNTADTPFSGSILVTADYSAFNAGGPEIGLSIDNASETASYSSVVSGTLAYDSHSCALPAPHLGPDYFSALTCGVVTPDSSENMDVITDLPPDGGTVEYDWSIVITESFAVPEPGDLAIFGPAILAVGLMRARRKRRPQGADTRVA